LDASASMARTISLQDGVGYAIFEAAGFAFTEVSKWRISIEFVGSRLPPQSSKEDRLFRFVDLHSGLFVHYLTISRVARVKITMVYTLVAFGLTL
jgi:hypothetical protein